MSPLSRREWRWVLAIAIVAFAARAAFGLAMSPSGEGVRGYGMYSMMADRLLKGETIGWQAETDDGWRWAHRTPLYPIFVAGIRGVFGHSQIPIVFAQSLLAALSVLVLHRLGRRLVGPPCAVLAAAGFALYPYCVGNDTAFGEQPLLTLLTLLLLLAADTAMRAPSLWKWAVTGALGGACIMARTTALPGILLVIVALWSLTAGRGAWRTALAVTALGTAIVVCVPWMIRNASVVGQFTLVTDAGRSLWIANNAHTFDAYPTGSIDDSERIAYAHMDPDLRNRIEAARGDEVAQDALYREEALKYLKGHPREFVERGARKALALLDVRLTPNPNAVWKSWAYGLSYGAALLLGLIGLFRLRGGLRPLLPWVALLAGSIAVSFVYWGQTRLRVSLDPVLLLLAARGFETVAGGGAIVMRLGRLLDRAATGPATRATDS